MEVFRKKIRKNYHDILEQAGYYQRQSEIIIKGALFWHGKRGNTVKTPRRR